MKHSFTHLFILFILAARVIVFSSCANILPPGGGPRDSLPPRLVVALPRDSALNVSPKNITLTFDEYVQSLQNVQENLIVSPTLKYMPVIDSKLRNVTIKIKDTLDPNTTYSFSFGDAIRDVNEGNVAKGLTYVFSTGNTIDYNTYGGKVISAESGKIDSTLIVVLHRNLDDSAVVKEQPRYYARVNGQGRFLFHNLPAGTFAVYVVEPLTKKYDDSTRSFAFRASGPVTISANTKPDTLFAYQQSKRSEKIIAPQLKLAATNKDDKRLRYTTDLEIGQQDILGNLNLQFNRRLTAFDTSKIVLYDTNYVRINGYSLSLDSTQTKFTLTNRWKEATPFRLLIAKDAVSDSAGTTLAKADTIRFVTKKEADYGSIRLRFTNLDLSKHPVLQFVQSEKVIESFPLTQAELIRKLYRPGSYELRILYDSNQNGRWDPGHFFGLHRQPEIVQLIPRQLVIRSNWDNEVTIPL
ncbi:MAG: hypothetical protein JWQ78_144 [Sediminibacterium sp.]|nr:hypothetical protein [Sediminibacterium sp.]